MSIPLSKKPGEIKIDEKYCNFDLFKLTLCPGFLNGISILSGLL
jgi:hypothetical protein